MRRKSSARFAKSAGEGFSCPRTQDSALKYGDGILQDALHEGPAALGEGAAHFGLIGNDLRGAGKLAIEIDGRIGFFRLREDQAVNTLIPGKLRQVMARARHGLGIILRREGIRGFQFAGVEVELPLRQLQARRIDIPACRPGAQEDGGKKLAIALRGIGGGQQIGL